MLPGHLRVMFPTEATPTHRETSQLEDLVRRRRGDIFVWLGICPGCADIVAREVNTGEKLRPCSKRWRIAVRKYGGRIVLPQDKEFHPQVEMGLSKIGGTLEPGEQRRDRTASGRVYLSKRRGPPGRGTSRGEGLAPRGRLLPATHRGFRAVVHEGPQDRSCGSRAGQRFHQSNNKYIRGYIEPS